MSERYPKNLKHGKYIDINRQPVIHKDMQKAYTDYDGTGDSFKKVFEERRKKTAKGEKYWNDEFDEQMIEEARERNKKPDFKWPLKRGEPDLNKQMETFRQKLRKIWK